MPISFIDLVEVTMEAGKLDYLFPSNDLVFSKRILGVTLRGQTSGDKAYSYKGRKLITDQALDNGYLVLAKDAIDVIKIPLSMLKTCCEQKYFALDLNCLDAARTRVEFKDSTAFAAEITAGEALELIFVTDGPK